MKQYHYHRVDVFTDQPFGGNQLAVFTDAEGLDTATMQKLANELNLSETTFVLPPQDPNNDFQVRIFTPDLEMPMAGHPTIGTAFVLHHTGKATNSERMVFEEGVGPIPVTMQQDAQNQLLVAMQQPMPEFGPVFEDRAIVAEMLSLTVDDLMDDLPIEVVSTGVPYIYIPVKTLAAMQKIKIRVDVWEQHLKDVVDFAQPFPFSMEVENPGATVHSRMFAPGFGIPEDPATGSASGPLGAYLVQHGLVKLEDAGNIVSEQGIEMGRPSLVQIAIAKNGDTFTEVRVGGYSQYVGAGYFEIDLP